MSGRRNSIAVYRQIEANGLLSKMRWEVYATLFHHGPATASELAEHLPNSVGGRGGKGNVHARLGELVERRVAEVTQPRRKCKVTGNEVQEYDVTDKLPVDPDEKTRPVLSKVSLKGLQRLYQKTTSTKDKLAIARTMELAKRESES